MDLFTACHSADGLSHVLLEGKSVPTDKAQHISIWLRSLIHRLLSTFTHYVEKQHLAKGHWIIMLQGNVLAYADA